MTTTEILLTAAGVFLAALVLATWGIHYANGRVSGGR